MAQFFIYDIIFLILFTAVVAFFLYKNRKNLARDGWMFLYKTKWGINSMKKFDEKYHKILGYLRYVIVTLGYLLMAIMIYMLLQTVYIYISEPNITDTIKAPPIAPLIPYFPELFGMESYFPPFYFTYFLVALAIVAIVHEFAHGIYMRYSKTKIKSTGLAFLGPILGAFVEEDKENFHTKDRFNQMSVLGAGVFANVLFAIIFYLIYTGFFYLTFTSGGFIFNSYAVTPINSTLIQDINHYENYSTINLINNNQTYFLEGNLMNQLNSSYEIIYAYDASPAYLNKIKGIIIGINNYTIKDQETLSETLSYYSPNDNITLYSLYEEEVLEYNITLGKNPLDQDKAFLGITHLSSSSNNKLQLFLAELMGFSQDSTYYKPKYNNDLIYFFYHLFWWVMIINFLVALFNMLPLGILDGGRFFYLTIEKFTKKEKTAMIIFNIIRRFIIFLFILMMVIWLFRII
ncbi:MAG: site-2 protease family protein [Candidatus Nanoarchaeia archaeon]|jgi:membrane-associated protease RseP (regulator of RpoE activity)|nr:site-2 protease family protein [Candidatus Nanoarchaeia archaeon]MDD3993756.1 site-2 protease family protein [Candidatus Nanoarchaeia archaeon]MDD4563492.1 site-2 protease family protein [Candidatus Nanoarchaeia archaeon]